VPPQKSIGIYVEARYVKSVLREAQSADQDVACKLIDDLLRDLRSLQTLNDASAQRVSYLDVDVVIRPAYR
jgi:hypothetical protein